MVQRSCPRKTYLSERLEGRYLLASVAWNGGGDGRNGSDPLNWPTESIPLGEDDVAIAPASHGNPSIAAPSASLVDTLTVTGTKTIGSRFALTHLVLNNGTLRLIGDSSGYLFFTGAADCSISGNGLIEISGHNNGIFCDNDQPVPVTLTIGADVTIRMIEGTKSNVRAADLVGGGAIINHGTIEAAAPGGILSIGGVPHSSSYAGITFFNDGILKLSNGATMEIAGTWDSTTGIQAGDGLLWLMGNISPGAVSKILRTGTGATRLDGNIDLAKGDLAISDTSGTIQLYENGYLQGPGSVITSGNAELSCIGGTLLNGPTLQGRVVLTQYTTAVRGMVILDGSLIFDGGQLWPDGGWTIDILAKDGSRIVGGAIPGTVTLEDANATLFVENGLSDAQIQLRGDGSRVVAVGSQTWVRSSLHFDGEQISSLILKNASASEGAVFLFQDGTIDGANGEIIDDPWNTAPAYFENDGTIQADAVGELRIAAGIFTNLNWVGASNGGTLRFLVTPTNLNPLTQSRTDGSWQAGLGGTLLLPSEVATNAASIYFEGVGASIPAMDHLQTNQGSISLAAGGVLSIDGDVMFSQQARLFITISGPGLIGSGLLQISGKATLDGPLDVQIVGTYRPTYTESFPVVQAASIERSFRGIGSSITPDKRRLRIRSTATIVTIGISPVNPAKPTLTAETDTGTSKSDGITQNHAPSITGTISEGVSVRVYVDGAFVATAPAPGGNYTVSVPPQAEGIHNVTVTAVDVDGDESGQSISLPVTIDSTPPVLRQISFGPLNPTQVHAITVLILDASAFAPPGKPQVFNLTTNTEVPSTSISLWSLGFFTARFVFSGLERGMLPDGNYSVSFPGSSISDVAGNSMVDDPILSFFVLAGDANQDRVVNDVDLGILARNWQGTGKTFAQGDLNYDTTVDLRDLNILAAHWQQSLPPAAAPLAAASRAPRRAAARALDQIINSPIIT